MHSRLLRTTPLLIAGTLCLSACGGGNPDADQALTKIHDRMMEHIGDFAVTYERPLIAKTTSALNVNILPASDSFKGTSTITLSSSMLSDATDVQDPRADLSVTLNAAADFPAGTFSETTKGKSDHVSLAAILNARSVGKILAINIPKLDAVVPAFLPTPFSLPEAIKTRWYGKTFADMDVLLAMLAKGQGKNMQQPVHEIISNALRGIRMSPDQLQRLGNGLHLWKGLELLPVKDGLVQVRVESDKGKIRDSVRAILAYVQEVTGPSFETQMRTNAELQTMMNALTKNDAEFLRTMGSFKGILSADAATYDIRGFDGDIFDEKGTKTATVLLTIDKDGSVALRLTNVESNEALVFTKKGSAIRVTTGDNEVLTGTLSATKVDLTTYDPKTKAMLGSVSFDIKKFTKEQISLANGVITLPQKKLVIAVPSLTVSLSNSFKDLMVKSVVSGKLGGKPLFSADFLASRTEVAAFPLEKPEFRPFEDLRKDFTDAFMPPPPALRQ